MGSSVAIIFEEEEIPLGIKMMDELLKIMRLKGAEGILDTEKWVAQLKQKQISQQMNQYIH